MHIILLQAVRQCVPVICRFHFLDGTMRSLKVGFLDTADTVVANIATKLAIKSPEGWAIYEVGMTLIFAINVR